MPYKIAIASSDQVSIDGYFGSAPEFLVYEVADNGEYALLEIREAPVDPGSTSSCEGACQGNGCCGFLAGHPNVELIGDCRCVVCKKIGFHMQRQLEKKAISTFDVEGKIEDVLHRITLYFHRVDHHLPLKRNVNETL
ncbi:MAG: hypothetical protein LBQ71_16990 [Hungatella sp.]|jgi:predicted Fe-Mo cluster-binding NifX family protein|nr:hypothetical protein [Hungatella sp.]